MSTPRGEEFDQPNIVGVQYEFIEIGIGEFDNIVAGRRFLRGFRSVRYALKLGADLVLDDSDHLVGDADGRPVAGEILRFVFVDEYLDGGETLDAVQSGQGLIFVRVNGGHFGDTLHEKPKTIVVQKKNQRAAANIIELFINSPSTLLPLSSTRARTSDSVHTTERRTRRSIFRRSAARSTRNYRP